MTIRKTSPADIPAVLAIYDAAREFMKKSGNPGQWRPGYPSEQSLRLDISRRGSYVCIEDGRIVATFFFIIGQEPTYQVIEDGAWLNDDPYGVIHRVATDGSVKGIMHRVLDFCFTLTPNIRIDTHHDNQVMQRSLIRYGFIPVGTIHVADGSPRVAFQMTSKPQ